MIFVFERRRAVGSVPSIQMYSALIATVLLLSLDRADECSPPGLVNRSLPARDFSAVAQI